MTAEDWLHHGAGSPDPPALRYSPRAGDDLPPAAAQVSGTHRSEARPTRSASAARAAAANPCARGSGEHAGRGAQTPKANWCWTSTEKDFHVFDNGVEQKIEGFDMGGAPLSVVIVRGDELAHRGAVAGHPANGILFTQTVLGERRRRRRHRLQRRSEPLLAISPAITTPSSEPSRT